MTKYLRPAEVAQILGVSDRHARRLILQKMTHYRLGPRSIRVSLDTVTDFLTGQRCKRDYSGVPDLHSGKQATPAPTATHSGSLLASLIESRPSVTHSSGPPLRIVQPRTTPKNRQPNPPKSPQPLKFTR